MSIIIMITCFGIDLTVKCDVSIAMIFDVILKLNSNKTTLDTDIICSID